MGRVAGHDGQEERRDGPDRGAGDADASEQPADVRRHARALDLQPPARDAARLRDRQHGGHRGEAEDDEERERQHEPRRSPFGQRAGQERPEALPPACASAANSAARSPSGSGSSSTSAAAAAPLIIPTARPWTARAANSHASLLASANSSSPNVAVANPAAITRRRPSRSESWPKTSSEGASTQRVGGEDQRQHGALEAELALVDGVQRGRDVRPRHHREPGRADDQECRRADPPGGHGHPPNCRRQLLRPRRRLGFRAMKRGGLGGSWSAAS